MKHSIRQLMLCSLLLVVFRASAMAPQQPTTEITAGSARVLEMKGDVQVQLPAQTLVPASREMMLPPGSKIVTKKGSALLRLEDGSEVLVKGNTDVLIQSPAGDTRRYLDVLIGKIRAVIKKRLEGSPSFKLGTPTAVITVRGTQFEVEVGRNLNTNVYVYEGLVEVSGFMTGGRPVLLGPGYMTDIRREHEPEPPRRMIQFDDRSERGGSRDERSGTDRGGDSSKSESEQSQGSSTTQTRTEQERPDDF